MSDNRVGVNINNNTNNNGSPSPMRLAALSGIRHSPPGATTTAPGSNQPFSFDYSIPLEYDLLDGEASAATTALDASTSSNSVVKTYKHIPPRIDQDFYQAEIEEFVGGSGSLSAAEFKRIGSCDV